MLAMILLVVALLAPRAAHADSGWVVRDGDEFSLEIYDDTACFVAPADLHARVPCPDVDPKKLDAAPGGARSLLAVGGLVLKTRHAASFTLFHSETSEGLPDPEKLDSFTRDFAAGAEKTLGPSTKLRAHDARLTTKGALKSVLRFSATVGDPSRPELAAVEYMSVAIFFASTGSYALALSGRSSDAAEIDALVDQLASNANLLHPATQVGPSTAYRVGQVIPAVALGIAALTLIVLDRRRKKRREAEARAKKKRRRKSSARSRAAEDRAHDEHEGAEARDAE